MCYFYVWRYHAETHDKYYEEYLVICRNYRENERPYPVYYFYVWGERLEELEGISPDLKIVNLESLQINLWRQIKKINITRRLCVLVSLTASLTLAIKIIRRSSMEPRGLLLIEHRLIERMIEIIKKEISKIKAI